MIQNEYYMTRKDGVVLMRTWSDEGFYIERDGIRYSEAVDPEGSGRVYTETDELVPVETTDSDESEEELNNEYS